MFKPVRCLGIALVFFVGEVFGTTYYVDSTGGSDSNSGTSTTVPWKTIAKVNRGPYSPGDSILFKAGDTWSGNPNFSTTLTTPSAGSSGNPIRYGSYGTGPAPILDGGNSLATGVNVTKNYVTITGLQIQNLTNEDIYTSGSNTSITYDTLKNASNYAVYISGGSNILVDHTTYTTSANWSMGAKAFFANSTGGVTYTHNTCDLTNLANPSGPICFVVDGGSNNLIQYNYSHGGSQAFSIKPYGSGCPGPATAGGVISDNYGDLVSSASSDGELIELEGCPAYPQSNIVVERNVLVCYSGPGPNTSSSHTNTADAIGTYYSNNNIISGNIFIGPCGYGSLPNTVHLGSSYGDLVYNNTFTNGRAIAGSIAIQIISSSSVSSSGVIKNNIFDNYAKGIYNANSTSTSSEDYNIFNSNVTVPVSIGSGAAAISRGGHSKTQTDPLFVVSPPQVATDMKLQANSPAKWAGASLGSPYNLILDPMGIAVPFGTYDESSFGWMIGAFGYRVPSAPVSIVGAKITGGIVLPQ